MGGARGPRPEDEKAFLEQAGITKEDLEALAILLKQQQQQEELEVADDYEDSDDYYAGGRNKAAGSPPPAAPGADEQPAAAAEGDEVGEGEEGDVEREEVVPEAEAEAAEPVAEEPLVEEVVVEVVPATPSEYIEVEVTEEYENVPLTTYVSRGVQFLHTENLGRGIMFGVAAVLGATLGLAVYRTWTKYTSNSAQRKRQVDKNKLLVEELAKYLPENQGKLTSSVARALKGKTGFTEVEIFRKFLWYGLRERKFDQAFIDDLAHLRTVLQLSDDDVAAALKERAQRVYDKYGTLMLNTTGMTGEGIERKATCKALFQKILYITECEALLPTGSPAADSVNLREIFGATEEDLQEARIVSLYDVDLERLDAMASAATDDATPEEPTKSKEEAPAPAPTPAAETPSPPAAAPAPAPENPSADATPAPSKTEFVFEDVQLPPVVPIPSTSSDATPDAPAKTEPSTAETNTAAVPPASEPAGSSPAPADRSAAESKPAASSETSGSTPSAQPPATGPSDTPSKS